MSSTARAIVQAGWAFRVGEWLVEPSLNRVSWGDEATQLEFKAMDVLVYLAARAGELVDKRELQDAVWQTEFVSDNTLTRRIAELRDAFGDDAHSPRYIETIPKRGYRLIAPVTAAEEVDETVVAFPDRLPPERERPPYPGLFPFIEADAADFFGREAEVTALWRKITDRRLLAVVGPSGVGKSSLLRAGVVARVPPGWRAVICHPGETPVLELAQALTPEFAGKLDELQALLRFQDPDVALALVSRWRGRWGEALIVVDQFEELFTLTTPRAQQEFVALLRRLVDAAGIHVVLVLRDDFLYECHRFPELDPVLKDLTLVGPPVGAALRRALTEPAARRQYHFEGEPLVDEMVAEVERERGALPLIAFAASRMWELRDTERRLLTREAYEQIGGVGGALAQHAEATLEAIGPDRRPIVRELFRNLVTAQGTRAVRDVDELVSVFGEGSRAEARFVLRALTDARLLTSFEGEAGEGGAGGPRHRVEVVHESLLRAWPRLVRWQAQDAEGALLRDQLRQAAHLWEDKGRPDDLLWAGASYREYAVWRERYPGALSELEEAFARSMTELADRRRRRRRAAATAAIVVLLAVAAALTMLWRRSVQETRRAEAAKLLALAQARLADDPTEALALTTASLEVADTREAREFVMRVLWTAPPALELEVETESQLPFASFSPDGRRVAVAGQSPDVKVWTEDGTGPIRLSGATLKPPNTPVWATNELLVAGKVEVNGPQVGDRAWLWSIPEGKPLRTIEFGSPGYWSVGGGRLFAQIDVGEGAGGQTLLKSWRLPDGQEELLDSLSAAALAGVSGLLAAPDGSGWVVARGSTVSLRPFGQGGPEKLLDALQGDASVEPFGDRGVLVLDQSGNARLWSFGSDGPSRMWAVRRPIGAASALPDSAGRRFGSPDPDSQSFRVWERAALPEAKALELRRSGWLYYPRFGFHPGGDWGVATTHTEKRLTFWPLARPYSSVVEDYGFPWDRRELAFSPDSRWLATGWKEGVRLLPVEGDDPSAVRELRLPGLANSCANISFDPEGCALFVVSMADAWVVPLDGGSPRLVVPGVKNVQIEQGAISPSGSRLATAVFTGEGAAELYVIDVDTDALQSFALPRPGQTTGIPEGVNSLEFLDEHTLLTMGWGGLRRWDLATGTHELVVATDGHRMMRASRTAGIAVHWAWASNLGPGLDLVDLGTGARRPLPGFGDDVEWADLDTSGTVAATGSADGSIRVGRLDGSEPHLLLGHTSTVTNVAISPDLRWLASADVDQNLRLWPMPDLTKPPLHTLPHDELLAKLKSLTNLRAVRDPAAPGGWTIELGPFPGWRELPTW
jgi:DNA-binding winged helix-turn-helix (wHTH) protein/WD40 repeat protein